MYCEILTNMKCGPNTIITGFIMLRTPHHGSTCLCGRISVIDSGIILATLIIECPIVFLFSSIVMVAARFTWSIRAAHTLLSTSIIFIIFTIDIFSTFCRNGLKSYGVTMVGISLAKRCE